MYVYYSTERPVGPGTYPKPKGNFPFSVENYDSRTFIPEIEREAWGKLTYVLPLTPEDIADYELIETKGETK